MRTLVRGTIESDVPFVMGSIDRSGLLVLDAEGGIPFTVDTGFSGGIAIPSSLMASLGLRQVDTHTFILATGLEVRLPVFWGRVRIGSIEIETWFVPGEALVGMEALGEAGDMLVLDLRAGWVELARSE